MRSALREHWQEYLIEGWALGFFMIAVGSLVTLFQSPRSLVFTLMPAPTLRVVLLAAGIGASLTLIIESPWGRRSGAHINPAITLAFLRAGKVHPWDAVFYGLSQTIGGVLGVAIVASLARDAFTAPPVHYAITTPGKAGEITALLAEVCISFVLMATILIMTASPRLIDYTPTAVGAMVAIFIVIESPLSGTSMNPARTLASALPGRTWDHLWIYIVGPTLGMLLAAEVVIRFHGKGLSGCAKLLHPEDVRCIHCGHLPPALT